MTGNSDLKRSTGRGFWQALDELVDRPEFRTRIADRFPGLRGLDLDRRDIIKCLGATLALAGLDGCEREPDEEALPYINNPPGGPGAQRSYATAVELDGVGQPIIGYTRDGRPIKLEGNPDHPASGGSTDAFTQAALLGLYDPARSAVPLREGAPATWADFEATALDLRRALDASKGAGLHVLTGRIGSPTLQRQIDELRQRWPQMRWHMHDPLAGLAPETVLPLAEIEALVVLDADPLGPGPYQTIHARGWSARRQAYQRGDGAALLFVAEPAPTLTGVAAGERLIARSERIPALLAGLEVFLRQDTAPGPRFAAAEQTWIAAAGEALRLHHGRARLTLGSHHPASLHSRVAAINAVLGSPHPLGYAPTNRDAEDLTALVAAMRSGAARAVLVLDANPAYTAPHDLQFAHAFAKVPLRVHAGLHVNETAERAHWQLPTAHLLESWSDVRAADGSAVIVQPLVRPFLDVRSRHDVLAVLTGEQARGRTLVQRTWDLADGDPLWEQALVRGWVEPAPGERTAAPPPAPPGALPPTESNAGLDVLIRPDPSIHDGQFADNPWLQELPKPLTKITWDNAIHVGPQLATRLGLENGRSAELALGGAKIQGAIWVLPGMAPNTVLVHLGYGRRAAGKVGKGIGFDAYALRTTASPWLRKGGTLRPLGGDHPLATTQSHFTMAGHDFVRFVDDADGGLPPKREQPSMYPPQPASGTSWGMAIDLDLCIGCNACVTACVAENNIPMVGKEQVQKGREMHWLRVDRYYEGAPEDPKHVFQPVPCMHCEDAPCEMGCPVNATVHSPDGLNLQVYNRCVGTRTCSAFCPYKVRRFNWLDYTRGDSPELRAVRNPEVTVRDRGVMEKCTYCIQRIETEKIDADAENRPMSEVKTACQQACPTNAIVFGNIADESSAVSQRKADRRDYDLLEEANTRPRTTYSARIRKGRVA